MDYKERKKMYKVGKKWVVATIVSTSVLMGGVVSAHADQVTTNSDNAVVTNTASQPTGSSSDVTSNTSTSPSTITGAVQVQLKQSTNVDTVPSENNQKKLNPSAAQAVNNAHINVNNLTEDQINELNKINFSKSAEKGAKLTFKDLEGIGNAIVKQDPRYTVPYFNAKEINNMPAAYAVDAQTGKMAHLDVWDSWPVQDAVTGYVSNYKGYQLVIAMMGIPNTPYGDNHIYLLYNKYGDNDFSHWRNAGSIFGNKENNVYQEWSGSAIVNNDGSIQLFYTSNDTSDFKLNDQKLATATLHLNVDDNGVSIASVDNNHVIFEGDGYHYQTYQQFAEGKDRKDDDYCLRDPHVVQLTNGDRYLVFEANTGKEDYQSDEQIYNWANYGGDDAFNIKSFFKLLNNKKDRELAGLANGSLGILKLNNNQDNPEVDEVYSPLVSTLMASDEVERPDIVKLGGKYYLFSVTRVSRGSDTELTQKDNATVGDNVAMIGYVADNLMGPYKPLNNSGVVLTASVPANWRTATYSYFAVPVEGHPDQVLITSYMSNKDFASGKGNYATWAPSFLVQINSDNTTMVLARATNQGDWIWDNSSRNDKMLGVLDKNAANSAALPGEWGKPVDWSLINRSAGLGLKPHQGADPSEQPNNKPGTNPGNKPGTNPDNKPGDKPGTNPDNKPGDKPGTNPDNIPGNNPGLNPRETPNEVPGKSKMPGMTSDQKQSENKQLLPQTGNGNGLMALFAGSLLAMFGIATVEKQHN